MKPTKVQWTSPKYVKQIDQNQYNRQHGFKGLGFNSKAGLVYWQKAPVSKRGRTKKVWHPGDCIYHTELNMNGTIIRAMGVINTECEIIFEVKLEDNTLIAANSRYLDIGF